jgi:hypothetical protein
LLILDYKNKMAEEENAVVVSKEDAEEESRFS